MKKIVFLFLLLSILLNCDGNFSKKTEKNNTKNIYSLIFDNAEIQKNMKRIFDNDNSTHRFFKISFSRRDKFARVTITEIFYSNELLVLPKSIIIKNKNAYALYDGYELFEQNDKRKKDSIINLLNQNKIILKDSTEMEIIETRYLQFDLFPMKKLVFNFPAIEPSDKVSPPKGASF